MRTGRTIVEEREKLETASERMKARKKSKKRQFFRIFFVSLIFVILLAIIVYFLATSFTKQEEGLVETTIVPYAPTIEVIDEDAVATGGMLTNRMSEYIGQAESDFKDLGYRPLKVVIPTGKARELHFYLEGYEGYIKMTIDRGTAVSVEDADRMIRYLNGEAFEYIDVRVEGKGYWK